MKLPCGKQAEAIRLIWRYMETRDEDYLKAAAILDSEEVKAGARGWMLGYEFGRGNRRIGDVDPALVEMARKIVHSKLRGEPVSIRSAALDVAHMVKGNSLEAKERRLRREYNRRGAWFELLAGGEVMNAAIREFASSLEAMSDIETAHEIVRGVMAIVGRHHVSVCHKRFRANADTATRLLAAGDRDAMDATVRRWTKAARNAERLAPPDEWIKMADILPNILMENKRHVTR